MYSRFNRMLSSGILVKLCEAVDHSFGTDEKIRLILRDQPIEIKALHWLDILVVECLVINTNSGDIFVFKSSDSKEDWDDNLKFFPVRVNQSTPTCCFGLCTADAVHTGFNKQFGIIQPELLKRKTSTKAIFTGFSLGGALAIMSAYSLDYVTRELVTFGSPKVGNQSFVTNLERKLARNERWVYKKDYVTRLPPGKYYKHTGVTNVVGYNGRVIHTQRDGPFFLCNRRNYDDHDIFKYVSELEKFV